MEMFVVGGAVRDMLMGQEPKDIDYVVVGSTPEEMLAKGFKQVGADFPVFLSSDGTEYALARTERKSGRGYGGFVTQFGTSVTLEDDLARRDLTINAMASTIPTEIRESWVTATGFTLIDPFNGEADIEGKVLRHVSPAFADDPVRVLRLARFHARYGMAWRVAPTTMAFCRKMVTDGELGFLTRERVLAEMVKALSEQEPAIFFMTMKETGALDVVFPELVAFESFREVLVSLNTFKSRSAVFNYAKMMAGLSEVTVAVFENRLNVSSDFKAYAKMFRLAVKISNMSMVDRLYELDIFRKWQLWEAIVSDAKAAGAGILLQHVDEAFHAVKHVNFETLPEVIRVELKGLEIAAAIRQQRVFAFETSQRRK